MKKKLSVIIPIYNEENIKEGIERLINVLRTAAIPYEIILIDDGSKNDSWNQITDLSRMYDGVISVCLSRNFGKESALCAGIDLASGDGCVCLDADMQFPPEMIPKMYQLWTEEGYEVIEGIKNKRTKENLLYRGCANSFYKMLRKTSRVDLQNSSDFRLLDRVAIEALKSMPENQTFFRGMSSWIGFRRTQVFFNVEERKSGRSKWSLTSLTRLAVNALTSYSDAPLHIITVCGFLFLIFFVIMFVQTLYMKIMGYAQNGFTTVILLQLIIGSILMMGVGVIGLYIHKIYVEIKGRPRYIIRRIYKKEEEDDNME